MKHWMISTGAGYDKSLKDIQESFLEGNVAKDDFATKGNSEEARMNSSA